MSESGTGSQEKSYEATPKRMEDARRKGDIPRSNDLQTASAYLGLTLAIYLLGSAAATRLGNVLLPFLDRPRELADAFLSPGIRGIAGSVMAEVSFAVVSIVALPAGLILVLLFAQRAVVLAPSKIKPKLSRISPVQNAKQKYGVQGLVEFLKSAVKLVAVGAVTLLVLISEADRLTQYVQLDARSLPLLLQRQLLSILSGVLALALLIGLADLMWQRHSWRRKLRMSHQEMRDESRSSEGDPQLRQSRRDRARELANNRMLHDVPKADVVIANPTHYAVALKWSREPGTAPVCLAKGVDEVAMRIRRKAEDHGVPVHVDPPTARAVHATVEIGQAIPQEHYKAVAAAIVFADRMRGRVRDGLPVAPSGERERPADRREQARE